MPGEYLVPVYEPNHTYDCVVYDAPQNGTMKNGQMAAGPVTNISRTSPQNKGSGYVNIANSSPAGSKRSRRCWVAAGIVLFVVCLVLTLVNVVLLLMVKGHQDREHATSLAVIKSPHVNTSWEWGPWGPCRAECGYGMKSRERYCGNQPCDDGLTDKDICHAGKCEDSSSPVGFSAVLRPHLDNVSKGTIIIYNDVDYNHGQGYDDGTGIFTCPQTGAYMFIMFVQGRYSDADGAAWQACLALMIDGSSKRSLVSQPVETGQDETGGNSIIIFLYKGQKAWVETYYEDNQNIYSGRTTFSGVLLR